MDPSPRGRTNTHRTFKNEAVFLNQKEEVLKTTPPSGGVRPNANPTLQNLTRSICY